MKKIISTILIVMLIISGMSSVGFSSQAAESYLWPVPASTKINQYYSNSHDGLDIGGSLNTPVVATMSGTVVAVIHGDVAGKWVGYGNGVVIKHSNGYYSHYAHMNSTSVSNGQNIAQGQEVGKMGSTGNSTGVHLHFSVATSMYGAGGRINVNPGTINYIYTYTPTTYFTNVWSSDITETDAKINATISGTNLSTCGFYIGTSQSSMNKRTETVNGYVENIWYTMSSDYGALSKETTYYYKFFIVVGGVEFCSDVYTFTTKGCNHNYTSTVTTQPTCTKEGVRTYRCSSCGASYAETIAKTAHNKNTTISAVSATCTKTGLTEGKKCSVCGAVTVAQQTVAKKAHSEVVDKAVSATCTKAGLTEGKHCSVCGTVIVAQNVVDAIGHKDNNFDGKCDNCGISSSAPDNTPDDSGKDYCTCNCHESGFIGLFFKIINFFQKLFGMNKVCACGVKH